MITILLIIFFPLYSASFEIEELRQRLLFSAKSLEEYQYLDLNYKYLQVLITECESQVSKEVFPRSCYLAQARAERLGILFDKRRSQDRFDKSCFETVNKTYSSIILQSLEREAFLSEVCKQSINEQLLKLEYIHSH